MLERDDGAEQRPADDVDEHEPPGGRHSAGAGRPSQAYAVSAIISKGTTSTEPPETTRVASV